MSGFKPKKRGQRNELKSRDALRNENGQVHAVAKEFCLTKDEQRELHEEVTGQNLSFQELRRRAEELFGPASVKCSGKKNK